MCFRSSHRDSFRKYLFFFSRSNLFIIFQEGPSVRRTDMNFPEGSICSSNRHEFSKRDSMFFKHFSGGFIEKTCFFKEVLSVSDGKPCIYIIELQKKPFEGSIVALKDRKQRDINKEKGEIYFYNARIRIRIPLDL